MKLPAVGGMPGGEAMNARFDTLLFDLRNDRGQQHPLHDSVVERQLKQQLSEQLLKLDAPSEQWQRLDLPTLTT